MLTTKDNNIAPAAPQGRHRQACWLRMAAPMRRRNALTDAQQQRVPRTGSNLRETSKGDEGAALTQLACPPQCPLAPPCLPTPPQTAGNGRLCLDTVPLQRAHPCWQK